MANEKVQAALKQLEDGIQALTSSETWIKFLLMQAKFHKYSAKNTMLIFAQNPDATQVAGVRAWNELGRHVMKGQKGLVILAPCFGKKKPEDGEEDKTGRVFFKAIYVFDVSQTDGDELPAVVTKLQGDIDQSVIDGMRAFSEERGVSVTIGPIEGGANGFFQPAESRIVIKEGMSPAQTAKTLAHEITHSILHLDMDEYQREQNACELEAESTAFVVMNHFGLDSSAYSFGYVATWQGGGEAAGAQLKDSATKIQKTASAIISGVEAFAKAAEEPLSVLDAVAASETPAIAEGVAA